jgi:hypothetical protein
MYTRSAKSAAWVSRREISEKHTRSNMHLEEAVVAAVLVVDSLYG